VGLVAVLALGGAVSAAPVVTGTQVRTFLGGATGKLVYTHLDNNTANKTGRTLYYLDFSEETLVEHLVVDYHSANTEPRNAAISFDGQWVAYNTLQGVNDVADLYIARLQTSAPTPIALGTGALPYWWLRPGSDELYVIFNGKDLENGGWAGNYRGGGYYPPRNSPTYCQRVDPTTMAAIGSSTQLTDYQMNGGRSKNGAWMFAAGGFPMSLRIEPTAVAATQIFEKISLSVDSASDSDSLDGCNPSTSPHWAEVDIRFLYLDKPHTGYHICDVRGNNRIHRTWGSEDNNPYLDETQWSTHVNFAAGKGSLNDQQPPFDLYLFRISDGAKLKIIEGNNSFPFLWVDGSDAIRESRSAPAGNRVARVAYSNGLVRVTGGSVAGFVTVSNAQGRVVAGPTALSATGVPVQLAPGTYVASVRDLAGVEFARGSLLVR
jgi:hypothetical protein